MNKKEKVKDGCECSSDKQERKAAVREALYGAYYPSDTERDYAIDSFTKADLSIPEIESLVAPLKTIEKEAGKGKARIFKNNWVIMIGWGNTIIMTKAKPVLEDLKIELNKVWTPSELILNAYKAANAMDLFWPHKSEYINEARIFTASDASDPPAAIKHNIFSLYRKQVGTKEFLIFHELLYTTDYFQNKLDWTRTLGKVEVPRIVKHKSINPAAIRNAGGTGRISPSEGPPEIDSMEDVYLWEFQSVKNQLEQWHHQGVISPTAKFIAWIPPNKWSVRSFREFMDLSLPDLELIARLGSKVTSILGPEAMSKEILQELRETAKATIKEELAKSLGK